MYIRTKDGIYELVDELYCYHNGVEKFWYAKEENGKTLAIEITADKILKQSENLAELCDRAFAFHKDSPWKSPDLEDFSLDSLKEEILESTKNTVDEFIFKLAIWTDSGLTYVAKADGKGDLVLI